MPYKIRHGGTVAVTLPNRQKSPNRCPASSASLLSLSAPLLLAAVVNLSPLPGFLLMAPKWGRGVVRKVKQSVMAEKAQAASARATPQPPPRVVQALFFTSAYATGEMISRVCRALVVEFLEGRR